METACDLSLIVRDGRRVFPVWRTDLCDEVRQLDLWWVSGEDDDRGNDGQGGLGDDHDNHDYDEEGKEGDKIPLLRWTWDTKMQRRKIQTNESATKQTLM